MNAERNGKPFCLANGTSIWFVR